MLIALFPQQWLKQTKKTDIRSLSLDELKEKTVAIGGKSFLASQIFSWLHNKTVISFDDMTNVSKEMRKTLDENFELLNITIDKKLVSSIDGTVKYLFRLYDGNYIESVVMKYKYGYTICVSSQVGCRLGCSFCASGIAGFVRNLTAGEILSQIYTAQTDLDIKISHVVMMGVGEPLDNFDNVLKFLSLITCESGQNISMRNISLSTCGLVDKIEKLKELKLQLTLSVSLHAPNDEIRSKTMPVNRRYSIETLLDACRDYAEYTGRRISFEYSLISGVNDSDENAKELARRLKGMLCHVNLIPVNSVKERDYEKPGRQRIDDFRSILEKNGINATVRRTLGSDINASCGQLRRTKT